MDMRLFLPIGNNYSPKESILNESIGAYIKMSPISWKRESNFVGPEVITDVYLLNKKFMKNQFDQDFAIGLLLEPLEYLGVSPRKFDKLSKNLSKVLTFEDSLLQNGSGRYFPYFVGGSMLKMNEKLIFDQRDSKVSFVLSSKRITSGHKLRHKIALDFSKRYRIDLFGSGINEFRERHIPYSSYNYSIVVENGMNSFLFTEKLIDCLLHKTVPIYWGGSKVLEVFNPDGILRFNSNRELNKILEAISNDSISLNLEAIEINQRKALEFISKELNIYKSFVDIGFLPDVPLSSIDFLDDPTGYLSGKVSLQEALRK